MRQHKNIGGLMAMVISYSLIILYNVALDNSKNVLHKAEMHKKLISVTDYFKNLLYHIFVSSLYHRDLDFHASSE